MHLISRLLEVNSKKRANLLEISEHPWFLSDPNYALKMKFASLGPQVTLVSVNHSRRLGNSTESFFILFIYVFFNDFLCFFFIIIIFIFFYLFIIFFFIIFNIIIKDLVNYNQLILVIFFLKLFFLFYFYNIFISFFYV